MLPLKSIFVYLHACHSCFSDELLLEEDISNVSSISFGVINVMHLHHASDTSSLIGGIGRFNRTCNLTHIDSSSSSTDKRKNGLVQAFSHPECSTPSVHDMHAGYAHPKLLSHHMPHFPQNSPSRFCQRPVQRFSHMQSTSGHSEHSHPKGQLSPFIGITASPHSRGTNTFANGMPWGQRAGHPITTIPPTSHPHKDYGRIT
ncbi:Protein kinase domain-containing protein [Cinnamomum micranthum f. kanehirae]|uniref:Protein kinase domain-containing protein n=1 Tax=Cinnamomum micranthum f. kanehirae TaxID=337451 RepID=A0A3S3N8C1_9MAGN|nr:Protein kinase domain-containing protein [Cinnamomum micranthum f. kanehirae]